MKNYFSVDTIVNLTSDIIKSLAWNLTIRPIQLSGFIIVLEKELQILFVTTGIILCRHNIIPKGIDEYTFLII